jgi:hypothetical protein
MKEGELFDVKSCLVDLQNEFKSLRNANQELKERLIQKESEMMCLAQEKVLLSQEVVFIFLFRKADLLHKAQR